MSRNRGILSLQGIYVDNLHKTFVRRLKILGISVYFAREKPIKALDGLSLIVPPGEAVGIIGPNGAGKTTLMGCLLGFIHPESGKVTIDGLDPNCMEIRRKIGYVPERLNFPPLLTIRELMRFHYRLAREPPADESKRIAALLNLVGLPESKWNLAVSKCSRGMLQRLAIAQALISKPTYLFLDEPTSGIDPIGVLEILEVLTQIRAMNVTIVLNSHQLDQVQKLCERFIFIQRGKATDTDAFDSVAQKNSLILRFAQGTDVGVMNHLQRISEELEIPLLDMQTERADFLIADDNDAERLIRAVVQNNLPLVEAAPKENKLERIFLSSRASLEEAIN